MKLKNILFATAAVAALAACSGDDNSALTDSILDTPVEMELMGNIDIAKTRVSGACFEVGDSIGVTAITTVSGGLTGGTNVKYLAQSAEGLFKSASPIYYKDKNSVNVYAYYPYTAGMDADGNIAVKTASQVDYLYAKSEGVSYNNSGLEMTFGHLMTKLTFTVTSGTGVDNLNDLSKLTIEGVTTEGKMNTVTGALTSTSTANYELTSFATATNGSKSASVLLFPLAEQTGRTLGVKVTLGGVVYAATLNAKALLANTNYSYNVTVKRTGIEISKSVITDWVNSSNSENTDAEIPTDNN